MIILDSTLKSLEAVLGGAVTTNQLPFVAAYVDAGAAQPLLENDGLTNSSTAVTLAAAPAASVVRIIKGLSLVNLDTVAATATIRLNNNGTLRTIFKASLAVGDVLIYDAEGGFRVFDASGNVKSVIAGTPHALLDGSVNNDTLAGAPTRGAVIVANSSPAWAVKAVGAAGTLLRSDGTDTGFAKAVLTSDVSGILPSANGGTANGFTKFSGPGSSEKTFTLPNSSAQILTDAAAVTVPQGGTGVATLTNHGVVLGQGVSAAAVTAAGAAGLPLVGAGGSADPTFTALKPAGGGTGIATVTLTDGATPALDASLGSVFRLAAAGDRTIAVPSNATPGQKIVIQHLASGAGRTLALNSGAGGFRFGSDITSLSQTASGKTDYIGCIYNDTDSKWDVVAVSKGY